MKIGFVGLGKMGFNMVQRLLNNKHEVVVFNRNPKTVDEIAKLGAIPSTSLADLVSKLPEKKIVWLMVPSGKPVDENIDMLKELLSADDIIIDGGNSFWRDTQKRAEDLEKFAINYVDCGTSGGVWGLQNGYSLMYGGNKEAVNYVEPIFKSLAPEKGFVYCGPSGTGHMVKMVHNGIEYGMMQAYAEGFEILKKAPYDINLAAVADAWQYGSVVRSWLLELAVAALKEDPQLDKLKGFVQDSGEGRWTVQTAIDFDVPAHVITAALFTRFQSRQDDSFAMKLLAALRNQFGGHEIKTNN
ncbi:MAG: decarboxylating 6-phosphogluconate dehydrogenase [bacterium]